MVYSQQQQQNAHGSGNVGMGVGVGAGKGPGLQSKKNTLGINNSDYYDGEYTNSNEDELNNRASGTITN